MRIAIDVSPLEGKHSLQHRVRGTGIYLLNLKKSLLEYFPDNEYIFFVRGEKLPKNVDVIHYPYFEPFFLTLPIFDKYRSIVTVHDLTPLVFPDKFPSGIKGKIKWGIQKLALKNKSYIISDSTSSKKDIIKYAGISPEKVSVVYLAPGEEFKKIDLSSKEKEVLINKFNISNKYALYVGDVTWNKNLPRLIKAVKKTGIELVIVGKAILQKEFDRTNPWNQNLIEIQELIEGKKSIKVLGFVETEDLVKLYNCASLFVMPSLYEGFGLPILEAMACGCPVVTTKEGSLKEIAGPAAFYVNAYDENDIAKGMDEVYSNDKLCESLIAKGLIQIKKFTWEKTAKGTIKVYEKEN